MYNVAEYLPECLQSVIDQTFDLIIEALLVEDCSTDRSLQICKEYAERHPDLFKLMRNAENQGVSVVRNVGLDSARGDYFMFVDPDDVLPQGALKSLYTAATQNDADIVKGNNTIFNQHGEHQARYYIDSESMVTGDDVLTTPIGSGSLEAQLRQEVMDRELKVVSAGTASATVIREQLARSWLFVAPSITAQSGDAEGLGMVFLEAQALQTPVVSCRSGGLVEAVEEGATALLSAEKDVAGLAENIATLLENSSLRHHMGEAGRERVEQHFDLRKQCTKLESIYAKLS